MAIKQNGGSEAEREFADLRAKMKSQRLSWNYKLKNLEMKLSDFAQLVLDGEEEDEKEEVAREVKQIEMDLKQ